MSVCSRMAALRAFLDLLYTALEIGHLRCYDYKQELRILEFFFKIRAGIGQEMRQSCTAYSIIISSRTASIAHFLTDFPVSYVAFLAQLLSIRLCLA